MMNNIFENHLDARCVSMMLNSHKENLVYM